jgi:hypothetical protein
LGAICRRKGGKNPAGIGAGAGRETEAEAEAEAETETETEAEAETETEAEAEAEVEAGVGRIVESTQKSDVWAEIPIAGAGASAKAIAGLVIGVGFTENTGVDPKGGATEETFE